MKAKIIDRATGEVTEVELLIAVLGASNYPFAEATRTQQVSDFVGSIARALTFLGGVPNAIVPDKLKSAVTELDHHLYSAPYQLVREELWMRATANTVEVFHRGTRVDSHPRSHIHGTRTTKPEHMPSTHRAQAEWTPSRILGSPDGPSRQRADPFFHLCDGLATCSAGSNTSDWRRRRESFSTEAFGPPRSSPKFRAGGGVLAPASPALLYLGLPKREGSWGRRCG